MVTIYIIECDKGKYYVGKSVNVDSRIIDHFSSNGAEWTKLYTPLRIINKYDNCDDFDEDKYTIKTMAEYGIENVRGCSFVQTQLSESEITIIMKMINSGQNKCFYCNGTNNFIQSCPNRRELCYRCNRYGHKSTNCYAKKRADGTNISNNCYRCGRDGHWRITCNETTDKFNNKLNSADNLCSIM